MYLIEKTAEFDKWLRKLKVLKAKAKILIRIQKLETSEHFGDNESIGDGIRELKIDYAKCYRIYFKEQEGKIIILIFGGDKSTQNKDIERAKLILSSLKNYIMETTKFDVADYLDSNEMIVAYLNTVLAEGNDADVIVAIGNVAKSIGMSKIANETGLSRPSLYKALSDGSKPQFETVMKVLRAIGGQLQINPSSEEMAIS